MVREDNTRAVPSLIVLMIFAENTYDCRYGKTPSDEQMKTSGGFCPICQDSYQDRL